eukprot:m.1429692 g.1429692  ORF g.1429692 m.1429692 type:complete len:145 (+) comp25069_c0_seq51:192-626(+)
MTGRELNLAREDLTSVPVQALEGGYKVIDLQGNQIESIPPTIKNVALQLTSLNLSGNSLANLVPEITTLTLLRSLDVSRNHISILPENIGNLRALRSLNVATNNLTSLPSSISGLGAYACIVLVAGVLINMHRQAQYTEVYFVQ